MDIWRQMDGHKLWQAIAPIVQFDALKNGIQSE